MRAFEIHAIDVEIESGEGISEGELIQILRGIITALDISPKKKARLYKILDKLEKIIAKENSCDNKKPKQEDKCEHRIKHRLGKTFLRLSATLNKFVKKNLITKDEVNELMEMVNIIKSGLSN
ncbi:MAG: hypothetical protein G01um101430_93 [Parcubacteria group bacterium Gr01-1014_30]|nr:MAG: hypothetical protein G01um101430_93 [Parcubacteria group bacterium Gr01-1014_30]